MKIFVVSLIGLLNAFFSFGQIVNYEIDPTFDAGDFYKKGNIFNLLIRPNSDIIVNGVFHPSADVAGWTIIGFNGNLIDNSSSLDYGASVVLPYLNRYITCGSVISLRFSNSVTDYSFRFEFQKPAYSGFISSAVNDILVKDDSLLIVGGIFFTDSTDISPNSLRQLCVIDSTGAPIPGFPMVKCEPIDARIHSIDTLSTGEYIITGSFSSVNGHTTHNLAKLHSDFSVDTSFSINFLSGGTVFLRLIDSQSRIWASATSGTFIENPQLPTSLFRIFPDGSLDPDMPLPEIEQLYEGFTVRSYANVILEDSDQTFILGGSFNIYNGVSCKSLIKINDSGELIDGAFNNIGADEAVWGGWSEYPNISQIKGLSDGKLLIGGRFSSFGGEPYNCLVRLKPNGIVGIDEKEVRGKLKLYPNPAKSFIRIELPSGNEVINRVEIITVQGRVVKQIQNFSQDNEVSIVGLLTGIYIVTARTDTGVFTQKLVIE